MVQAIRYRVGQFLRAFSPQALDTETLTALETLSPEARELFHRQEMQDQRHALAVYRALRRAGYRDARLLSAALLHDVGKAAAPCPPWARAIAVLLGRFAPGLLARLADSDLQGNHRSAGLRRALAAHVQHAEVGARWVREAGCSACTVALIRRHREELGPIETEEDRLLAALQAADRVN